MTPSGDRPLILSLWAEVQANRLSYRIIAVLQISPLYLSVHPMPSNAVRHHFTPAEYLDLERLSPIKHEYLQGQVIAMAGASKAHVLITGNLSALFVNHLRGKGCLVYASDMKVRLPSLNIFYYPDLAVTCDLGDRRSNEDFILHPTLIVEVLSDSTEAFDRGDKFADYRAIAALEEYVLIHQKQVLIEVFQRKSSNLWLPRVYHAQETIWLNSIGFSAPVNAVYENLDQLT